MTKTKQSVFGFRATLLLYSAYTLLTTATIAIMTMLDRQFVSDSCIRFTYMLFFIFTLTYTPASQKIGSWSYIKDNFLLCFAKLTLQVVCAIASIGMFFTFTFFVLELPSITSFGESDLSGNNLIYFFINLIGLMAYFYAAESLSGVFLDKPKFAHSHM